MKIFIKAKPNAKEERIQKVTETNFVVFVKEPPVQGKANAAIIKALAGYFHVPVGNITIVSGFTSRSKVIEIKE